MMILESNADALPDWVGLYYASAQIHTETILYWAEVPKFFFKRLDEIDESDSESVKRRKYLFLEFLNRITELSRTKDSLKVDTDAILQKVIELGIADSKECHDFQVAMGIIPDTPEPIGEGVPAAHVKDGGVSLHDQKIVELNARLTELLKIIDKQNLAITQEKKKVDDQKKQISALRDEKASIEKDLSHQTEELKAVKEREYTLQARCKALESQLSGSEAARKQLEEDASVIGELQSDVEDLKTIITVLRRKNDTLQAEVDREQDRIKELENELLQSQKVAQESEQIQTQAISDSVETSLFDILKFDNFLPRRKKILVIGGSETKEHHLRGKLKNMGFDFSKDQIEFELDYDSVKAYTARIKPWDSKYAGIIVGPCPHKTKDTDGYSSFIEQLKSEEGYPHVEEARDKSGKLKISNASICDAMMKMAVYLQSTN